MQTGNTNYINYLRPKGKGIKLHLGCGDYWFDGYLNIDKGVYGGTDMLFDLKEKLPFQDSVVEIIEAHEFIEHFSPYELDKMLPDWKRVLIEGGKIQVTVPDIEELLKMGEQVLQQIYGIEYDHRWGYTKQTLEALFNKYGFKNIVIEKGEVAHRPGEPKLKLICNK